jgi:aryl-alcohol dehydrogenase-like predicted oxidoreductase
MTIAKNMVYRFLGRTGIKVSVLGFGNWVNNDKATEEDFKVTYDCMKM